MNSLRYLLPVSLLLVFAACSTVERTWQGIVGHSHPLTGKVWSVREKKIVSSDALLADLAEQEFVVLGERHDHPDHHDLQADIIDGLVERGRAPAVGFEQLNQDQASKLKNFIASGGDPSDLGEALAWQNSGWPKFSIYEPIFAAAMKAKLEIFPLSMGEAAAKRIRDRGLEGIDDHIYQELDLGRKFPAGVMALLGEEVRSAHCYRIADEVVPRMVATQRARDGYMAYLAFPKAKAGSVLIVGAGHARNEWGIPAYLRRLSRTAKIRTVAFIEVKEEFVKPEVYVESENAFDYLWFTPALEREDPCEKHKDQLAKVGKAKPENEDSSTAEKKTQANVKPEVKKARSATRKKP